MLTLKEKLDLYDRSVRYAREAFNSGEHKSKEVLDENI